MFLLQSPFPTFDMWQWLLEAAPQIALAVALIIYFAKKLDDKDKRIRELGKEKDESCEKLRKEKDDYIEKLHGFIQSDAKEGLALVKDLEKLLSTMTMESKAASSKVDAGFTSLREAVSQRLDRWGERIEDHIKALKE